MREIKFRVWDAVRKTWAEEYRIEGRKDRTDYLASRPSVLDGIIEPAGDNDIIFEQYTGLRDKNGREIYEGDILGGHLGVIVQWCDRCRMLQTFGGGECMACSGDIHWYEIVDDEASLEVIGNIHENPELMEVNE